MSGEDKNILPEDSQVRQQQSPEHLPQVRREEKSQLRPAHERRQPGPSVQSPGAPGDPLGAGGDGVRHHGATHPLQRTGGHQPHGQPRQVRDHAQGPRGLVRVCL